MRITHLATVSFPPRGAHEKISSTCAKIPTILSTFFSNENKEICFISRPGNGLSYCCFQSEPNPKPMPGMETEWKDNSHSEQSEHREREGGGEEMQWEEPKA